MKKSEIRVGGLYLAKINNKVVTCRVDSIRAARSALSGAGKEATFYDVTNMHTGRKTTFRSASKFRCRADIMPTSGEGEKRPDPMTEGSSSGQMKTSTEDKQRSDPTPTPVKLGPKKSPTPSQSNGSTAAVTIQTAPTATVTESIPPIKIGPKKPVPTAPAPTPKPPQLAMQLRLEAPEPNRPGREASELTSFLSKLQHDLNDNSPPEEPHIIITARAGTGKTTTLVAALQVLSGEKPTDAQGRVITPSPQQRAIWDAVLLSKGKVNSACFVAFNNSIARELKDRVPSCYDAMTIHSLGYRTVNAAYGYQTLSNSLVAEHISDICSCPKESVKKTMFSVLLAVEELVSLCKVNLITPPAADPDTVKVFWAESLGRLAYHYDIDLGNRASKEMVYRLVPEVLERCRKPNGFIGFDDMIWLPMVNKLKVPRYDLLLVDEAQDLNRCEQALALKAGKRLIFCGDPKQAIYAFAGADSQSMSRLEAELSGPDPLGIGSNRCLRLPLTVTRRCGKLIVEEAKAYVPDFEAHPSNPPGKVSYAHYPTGQDGLERPLPHYIDQVEPGDLILCRCSAPLVRECFRFYRRGMPAYIIGRKIGQNLARLVKKFMKNFKGDPRDPFAEIAHILAEAEDWRRMEVGHEKAKPHVNESKIELINDKVASIACFSEGCHRADQVVAKIEKTFVDTRDNPGVKLATIHKAKGLEARRVFFIRIKGAECPLPRAKLGWELEQEENLCYVALTRAIEELVHVS